ncbi:MAG: hypothetical protein M3P22_02095 [bacterium]|nr:hypothetical protein [bacterium]
MQNYLVQVKILVENVRIPVFFNRGGKDMLQIQPGKHKGSLIINTGEHTKIFTWLYDMHKTSEQENIKFFEDQDCVANFANKDEKSLLKDTLIIFIEPIIFLSKDSFGFLQEQNVFFQDTLDPLFKVDMIKEKIFHYRFNKAFFEALFISNAVLEVSKN